MSNNRKKKLKRWLRIAKKEKQACIDKAKLYQQTGKIYSQLVYDVRRRALVFYIKYLKHQLEKYK